LNNGKWIILVQDYQFSLLAAISIQLSIINYFIIHYQLSIIN
jgi:hypothetical protein